jgi:hypothetical protein
VNIVKSHKINQPNMNWTIKTAAKVVEGLNQSKENSDTKKGGIQHTKTRLGSLKEKWEMIANADYANNLMRQQDTSYQQKNNT